MSWRTLVTGLLVRDFLRPYLTGRPILKVLMAMSSKSPSISLNISQYMFEYVFRVSLSHIDKDNRELKGRGTLLHITKREPNARVSSLKEPMESAFRPSNHLIVTSSRLDWNTLHIKVSSLEWTAILWLKWFTCSTGSVRLYTWWTLADGTAKEVLPLQSCIWRATWKSGSTLCS